MGTYWENRRQKENMEKKKFKKRIGKDISPPYLLIVSENSLIGKLIRKKAKQEWEKLKGEKLI